MNHQILNKNTDQPLLDRLLKIRNITDDEEIFLNPKLKDHRGDPLDLKDMKKGSDLIIQAMKKKQSICIFGDYDVDGITSSYLLYILIRKYFGYKNISIMFPDRLKDGYGLKKNHLDIIQKEGHELVITVDNGITSIDEARYAKDLGLTLIITDHHKPLDTLPVADAIINPHTSENYTFKGLCGAGVVYKLANTLLKKSRLSRKKQKKIMEKLLPLVSIATVADVVPLVGENRAIVRRGLDQLTRRNNILPSLEGILDFVNINGPLKSYHIGFVIGPRINAGGRLATGYDSLKTLLLSGEEQKQALRNLDEINTERRRLQNEAYKEASNQINTEGSILIAADENFHQGIVGIVAGKLTEKHNKPAIVLHIDKENKKISGSLRGPDYFDVMDMLKTIQNLSLKNGKKGILKRFGGHKQAGGITINLEDLDAFKRSAFSHCDTLVDPGIIEKTIKVDTIFTPEDRTVENLQKLELLEPFGAANEEPIFIFLGAKILSREIVGKKGNGHLKLLIQHKQHKIEILYRSKGAEVEEYKKGETYDFIGKIKFDHYKKKYFINGIRNR